MKAESQVERLDELLAKTERIFSAARWIILTTLAGALWVARAEWNLADHERRITTVEGDVKPMSDALSRMKGHLGLSAVTPPKPPPSSNVVWSEDQAREQERSDEEAQATH